MVWLAEKSQSLEVFFLLSQSRSSSRTSLPSNRTLRTSSIVAEDQAAQATSEIVTPRRNLWPETNILLSNVVNTIHEMIKTTSLLLLLPNAQTSREPKLLLWFDLGRFQAGVNQVLDQLLGRMLAQTCIKKMTI